MKRRPSHELLDADAGTPDEVQASLRDLRSFNRGFGGINTSRAMLAQVCRAIQSKNLSVLEVASGEGYVPKLLHEELHRAGVDLKITLLDRVPSHLPKNGATPKLAGDALQLPFHDSAFDLVSCSLFVHHLSPEQAVRFLREALRVCRMAVLVNDLVRHPVHLALAYAGSPWYRSRITRNDAPASVKQAYTLNELLGFFQRAGAARTDAHRHFLFRMGVIGWKR